jgi:L-amino acid N-acyltransferase YncA
MSEITAPGSPTVRPAERRDVAAITAIYNEGLRGRGATFETRERGPAEVEPWLADPRHPLLVAERREEVVGWISASTYRPRECYAGIAEFSVYVRGSARRARVGDALMSAFLPACEAAGLWKLVARIFPENAASLALCARHGFRQVGVYVRHGRIDGVWKDVVIVERLLGAAAAPP